MIEFVIICRVITTHHESYRLGLHAFPRLGARLLGIFKSGHSTAEYAVRGGLPPHLFGLWGANNEVSWIQTAMDASWKKFASPTPRPISRSRRVSMLWPPRRTFLIWADNSPAYRTEPTDYLDKNPEHPRRESPLKISRKMRVQLRRMIHGTWRPLSVAIVSLPRRLASKTSISVRRHST